jgi:hypothetical protein
MPAGDNTCGSTSFRKGKEAGIILEAVMLFAKDKKQV